MKPAWLYFVPLVAADIGTVVVGFLIGSAILKAVTRG